MVSAARLGAQMFTGDATKQTAALVLVFGSGQTSLDLCATCLLRWHHRRPSDGKEHDSGDLRRLVSNPTPQPFNLTDAQRAWLHEACCLDEQGPGSAVGVIVELKPLPTR